MEEIITRANIEEAAAAIRTYCQVEPGALGLQAGSGLGSLIDVIENPRFIDYKDIPHMASSTAPSHVGRFVIGTVGDRQVICMQGRLHSYEGYSAQQIAFPVCVMNELGVTELVATNAAGGINLDFEVGDLMVIDDHINMLGINPCKGLATTEVFPRFFDMTEAYSPALRTRIDQTAAECGLELQHGVYIGTPGPSFETPAEIRAFRTLGADAVGMSTIPEVIAANGCGIAVLGISMISNPAAGILDKPLDMDDVVKTAEIAAEKLQELLIAFVKRGA